ncbi:MAG: DUF4126 domain-containing protein [Gammaproteobacteria bacterium]|nr:DUF4126 domain-containing protein [Gammaproteobacteria bacterium]
MDPLHIISLTLGTAWASGINLYAAILMLGYLGVTGNIFLPDELQILTNPLVLGAAALMYAIEFFADKIPGIDSGWDLIHTFIRIPAGAVLAAGMAQGLEVSQGAEFAALLIGGGVAASSHTAKMGARLVINTSPEPVTNWGASIAEDITVLGGLWASLHYPWLFVALLILFLLLTAWLLPKVWGAIKGALQLLRNLFGNRTYPNPASPEIQQHRADILHTLRQGAVKKNK